jgi:hypothetical protein
MGEAVTTPASDVSPGNEGGRIKSQSARTLPTSSPNRERRKTAPEGAALAGSRQAAQNASPCSAQ